MGRLGSIAVRDIERGGVSQTDDHLHECIQSLEALDCSKEQAGIDFPILASTAPRTKALVATLRVGTEFVPLCGAHLTEAGRSYFRPVPEWRTVEELRSRLVNWLRSIVRVIVGHFLSEAPLR